MASSLLPPPNKSQEIFYDAASHAPPEPKVAVDKAQISSTKAATTAGVAELTQPFQSIKLWSDFEWSIVTYIQLGKEGFTADLLSTNSVVTSNTGEHHQRLIMAESSSVDTNSLSHINRFSSDTGSNSDNEFSTPSLESVIASMESICKMAEIFLERQQIAAIFSREPAPFQVGSPDVTLKLGELGQPVMVGMYTTDADFPAMPNDQFFLSTLIEPVPLQISLEGNLGFTKSSELVYRTYNYMALNNLRYGFISTSTYTRFFRRTSTSASCIEVSPAVSLFQCSPYTIMSCLVAMGLQCKLGSPRRGADAPQFPAHSLICYHQNQSSMNLYGDARIDDYYLENDRLTYSLFPICLPTPITYNLGHSGKTVPGRTKWWRVMQAKKKTCRIHFWRPSGSGGGSTPQSAPLPSSLFLTQQVKGSNALPLTLARQWGVNQGQVEITENEINVDTEHEYEMLQHNEIQRGHRRYRGLNSCIANKSTKIWHVVVKSCDYSCINNIKGPAAQQRLKKLENEARMYEHFKSHDKQGIPKFRIFGEVLGFLRVLALEHCGRQITIDDFKVGTNGNYDQSIALVQKMRSALQDVHSCSVLHRDIRLSNFVIDDSTNNGRVRIINFGNARLYVRLYPQAMKEEIEKLDQMCLQAMRGCLSEDSI